MSAEKFRAAVESGEVPVDCHDQVLRMAFIYLDKGLWDGNGVFSIAP
ncbi:rta1 domain protein [Colletotrichum truncatum]|uniref:Rta1 domain protein n=1 Tax=Colletotrichum truncatum TaxID=5467 RepID=A0ACC3Z529_COLTU|nr:rta1 domain protein [Colletotrichum truncatum]KAF6780852.1 rta1 domain protein [Colletotrichum truncatum]